jgi:butyrate kinase
MEQNKCRENYIERFMEENNININEMKSLARGALEGLRGEDTIRDFVTPVRA